MTEYFVGKLEEVDAYGIAFEVPDAAYGKLNPIQVSGSFLDEMTKGEKYTLAYNVARELRRVRALFPSPDSCMVVVPLLVHDYAIGIGFGKQVIDLIKQQNDMGESLDGRHVQKQVSVVSN